MVLILRLALVASVGIMPPLATTSLRQDVWLALAYMEWERVEPLSYWLTRLAALVALIYIWRRHLRSP